METSGSQAVLLLPIPPSPVSSVGELVCLTTLSSQASAGIAVCRLSERPLRINYRVCWGCKPRPFTEGCVDGDTRLGANGEPQDELLLLAIISWFGLMPVMK